MPTTYWQTEWNYLDKRIWEWWIATTRWTIATRLKPFSSSPQLNTNAINVLLGNFRTTNNTILYVWGSKSEESSSQQQGVRINWMITEKMLNFAVSKKSQWNQKLCFLLYCMWDVVGGEPELNSTPMKDERINIAHNCHKHTPHDTFTTTLT